MEESARLVLTVEGARKRRVPFPRNAGFEALKSLIAREFAPKSLVEISYQSDGDVFAIAADESLKDYLQENPLPPLCITLSSVVTQAAVTPNLTITSAMEISAPASLPQARAMETAGAAAPESSLQPQPLPGTDNARQAPNEQQPPAPPLEPRPPLAMCTLRLEAIGLPPRTVEIAPDWVEAMRLEEFMGLLTVEFEGRPVAGAPAIGASPETITGLVDSAESLHVLLRASLAQPVVLQVPLQPLPPTAAEAERKKKIKKPKPRMVDAGQPVVVPTAPRPEEDRNGKIRALAAGLAVPVDSLLANLSATTRLLYEAYCLMRGDEKAASLLGRAGAVTSLARLLRAVPSDLPTTNPGMAQALFAALVYLSDVLATSLRRAGVVAPLVGLIAHPTLPTANHDAVSLLFEVLRHSVANPENCAAFARAGVVAPLVRLLTVLPGLPAIDPDAAEELFKAISFLAFYPRICASFGRAGRRDAHRPSPAAHRKPLSSLVRAGVVAPLVGLLTAHPGLTTASPAVAEMLLLSIHNLLADHRTSFISVGVVAPLVGLLTAHLDLPTTNPALAQKLLCAIANIAADPEHRASLGRAGTVAPLVGMLNSNPDLATGVAGPLFSAIASLSADPATMKAFVSAGVVAPLVRLLTHLPITSPRVADELLRLLRALSVDPQSWAALTATPLERLFAIPGVDPELVSCFELARPSPSPNSPSN
ncbi:hypothetical protein PAPYR_4551 [Paratrimastix pyriformis]|uniref:PB1 domain-containing protein n=1 Tax=Paratrimastix pyriformis TaxID=342808 RepID=A0ABQ8UNB2_9EUKA|nr:hypothetical protein PAPYR_4551 [Paratrimastix pyriformis]